MADPATMAVMVGMQMAGSIAGGVAQNKAARHNAAVDQENAHRAEVDGASTELATRARLRALQGDALVAEAGSGVAIGEGSALEALRQNAVNASFDILGARSQAGQRAAVYRDDANAQKRAGSGALFGGFMGAGAAALSGMAAMRSMAGPKVPGGPTLPIPAGYGGVGGGQFGWTPPIR